MGVAENHALYVPSLLRWSFLFNENALLFITHELAGPRTSLDTSGVLLFVGALLSWLPVLAHRRILGLIGGGLECSVVAGGPQKIAGC